MAKSDGVPTSVLVRSLYYSVGALHNHNISGATAILIVQTVVHGSTINSTVPC